MDPQLQDLINSISRQQQQLQTLGKSLGGLTDGLNGLSTQLASQSAGAGGAGGGGDTPSWVGQFTSKLRNSIQQVLVESLTQVVQISDKLAGLGSGLSVLEGGITNLDGGLLTAAKNSTSLLEMGFDPLNRQVLNLAGRMDVTSQSTAVLFGSIEKLVRQTDMSSEEIGSLASQVQTNSEQTGVSAERIVKGLDGLSKQLDTFNLIGVSTEVQDLTLELQKGLPAALQGVPASIVTALTSGGPALRAFLGFEGDIDEILKSGAAGAEIFEKLSLQSRDRLDKQIQLSELGLTEMQSLVAGTPADAKLLNDLKQYTDALRGDAENADIAGSFDGSIQNLLNTIKEPLELISVKVIEGLVEIIKPLQGLMQGSREKLNKLVDSVAEKIIASLIALKDISLLMLDNLGLIAGALVASKVGQGAASLGMGVGSLFGPIGSVVGLAVGGLAGVVAGIFTKNQVDNVTNPLRDSLSEISDAIGEGNSLSQQQLDEERLSRITALPERQQTDFELFIGGLMRDNMATLMLSRGGREEFDARQLDALERIAAIQEGTTRAVEDSSDDSLTRSGEVGE